MLTSTMGLSVSYTTADTTESKSISLYVRFGIDGNGDVVILSQSLKTFIGSVVAFLLDFRS